jgi:hypothetical protein
MKIKDLKTSTLNIILGVLIISANANANANANADGVIIENNGQVMRKDAVNTLAKIVKPVLENASKGEFSKGGEYNNTNFPISKIEAVSRCLVGVAPFIELDSSTIKDEHEKTVQNDLRELSISSVRALFFGCAEKDSPRFPPIKLGGSKQDAIEAAHLALAFQLSPRQLWGKLSMEEQKYILKEFKNLRNCIIWGNNRELYNGVLEIFLKENGEENNEFILNKTINDQLKHYLGDGVYGDGEEFHFDYYNSYAIQPLLEYILERPIMHTQPEILEKIKVRAKRQAEIEENLISPEGTYPAIGRSMCYRMAAFHELCLRALKKDLPPNIKPAQVRCGLDAVMKRCLSERSFDKDGFLTIGVVSNQPSIADYYTNWGSPYMTTLGFLPLGLPPNSPYWADGDEQWTQKKLWGGENIKTSKFLKEISEVTLIDKIIKNIKKW